MSPDERRAARARCELLVNPWATLVVTEGDDGEGSLICASNGEDHCGPWIADCSGSPHRAPLMVQMLCTDLPAALDALDAQDALRASLFEAIKHGDQDHQDWLRQAIDDHFAGKPVRRP